MSTFSVTSPRITEADERKERESMKPEEFAEIEEDVRGTGSVIKETDEMKVQAVLQLEEAIDMIPDNERIDYLRALELCPELVRTESESILFLRCENYNPWAAAKRLVKFWEMRRKIFGEHAFLPLTLTGNGALSQDAIEMLHGGYLFGLADDTQDRTIMYFDRSRNQNSPQFRNALLQVVMYTIMVCLEERASAQAKGFVVLVNGSSSKIAGFDRKLARVGISLFRDCLPIKVKAIHISLPFRHPPFNFVLPVLKFILGRSLRQRVVVHHGSDLEVLMGLEKYGISEANVPPVLGGRYKLEAKVAAWLVDRLELESRREANA